MSKQRAKGTRAESALVSYLLAAGYQGARRRPPAGSADLGDIDWVDGVTTEVKSVRQPRYGEWLREAEKERSNAGTDIGIVVHKPHGTSIDDVGNWHVIMTLDTLLLLMEHKVDGASG